MAAYLLFNLQRPTSILWSLYLRLIKLSQIQFPVRISKNMVIQMVDRFPAAKLFTFFQINVKIFETNAWFTDTGVSNGNSSSSVSAEHWWGIWGDTITLDSWGLYTVTTGDSCCISITVIEIYWKLRHASNALCLLLLYETFFGPKVLCLF